MKTKQIRNATMIITYAGKKFLIDPMLADKGTYPPFLGTHNQDLNNPIVDLTVPIDEILDVDAVIVTHLHIDHFDPVAAEKIPKELKVFIQNKSEAEELKKMGFKNIEVLSENENIYDGIKLVKTPTKHYSHESILEIFAQKNTSIEACGVVMSHPTEKTIYIMGDTVWFDGLKCILNRHRPEVIVINAGNAQFVDGRYLIMNKEEILKTAEIAPYARLLATHMEGVNHLMLSRNELLEYAKEKEFIDRLSIPFDGEVCEF